MDSNPGVSLFQGADIQIDNAKNVEEEEDLEDQIRRKEEVLLLFTILVRFVCKSSLKSCEYKQRVFFSVFVNVCTYNSQLQNLLQAKLDDFNYDDSTINSSTNVSLVSNGNFEQLYKDAITPDEQLKVLYEVRLVFLFLSHTVLGQCGVCVFALDAENYKI